MSSWWDDDIDDIDDIGTYVDDDDDWEDATPSPSAHIYMGMRDNTRLYFDSPDPQCFQPEATALTLANIARFAGNYGRYSVAQHSVLVARLVRLQGGLPPQILAALHHDDVECVTNDIPSPFKHYLRVYTDVLDDVLARLDSAVESRYLVDIHDPLVKWADEAVFHYEVMRYVPERDRAKYEPLPAVGSLVLPYEWFIPWPAEQAFAHYMDIHEKMTNLIANKEVPPDVAASCS